MAKKKIIPMARLLHMPVKSEKEMDVMHLNKKYILLIIAWFVLINISIFPLLAGASTKEVENIDDAVTVQTSPDKQPEKQKQHTDPFTMAIIGLSFGCMMIASSLHWNMTQRKELTAQINSLDSFLASSCSVVCHIKGCLDDDPMMNAVEDIQERRDAQIEAYQKMNNNTARCISDIETKIMGIWG